MCKKPENFLVREGGTEIAEAALVLPIMFMLLLGIYSFGRALNTYETINHAAMEAARLAAMHTCTTCANGNASLQNTNTPLAGTVVQQALQASGLDPTQANTISGETVNACGSGPTPGCNQPLGGPNVCVYYDVLLNDPNLNPNFGSAHQSCGVYVSFQYPYQLHIPFLNLQPLALKARAQIQGEY